MATDYFVKNNGAAMQFNGRGSAIEILIDTADLCSKADFFVDSSGDASTVPSTGFTTNDTIQYLLPKGLVLGGPWATQIHTAEGGVATAFIGVTGALELFYATTEIDLNSITTQEVDQGDEVGYVVLNATTYLVITFDTAATAVVKFTFACSGFQIEQP